MAKAAPSAHQEALCYAAIDSIDPNIRYCAYNLRIKGGGAQDINTLLEMRKSGGAAAGLDLLASKVDVKG